MQSRPAYLEEFLPPSLLCSPPAGVLFCQGCGESGGSGSRGEGFPLLLYNLMCVWAPSPYRGEMESAYMGFKSVVSRTSETRFSWRSLETYETPWETWQWKIVTIPYFEIALVSESHDSWGFVNRKRLKPLIKLNFWGLLCFISYMQHDRDWVAVCRDSWFGLGGGLD